MRYDLSASLRNPRARFITFFFPILLLVVFNAAFGNGHTMIDGMREDEGLPFLRARDPDDVDRRRHYGGLVISISALRETGVLKRRRATPVPSALLIAGQALSTWS